MAENQNRDSSHKRQQICSLLYSILESDKRVDHVLAMGSTAEQKETELSDIDICVVMKNDASLNAILTEVGTLFHSIGDMIIVFNYNPLHFYVVFEAAIALDIYFVSSSLLLTIGSPKNRAIIDHRITGARTETTLPARDSSAILRDLLSRAYVRVYRLLSKLNKGEYLTFIYIANSIREEELLPLLALVGGYKFAHIKAVRLEDFDPELRLLYEKTYARPSREACIEAVHALAQILHILLSKALGTSSVRDLESELSKMYAAIMEFQ